MNTDFGFDPRRLKRADFGFQVKIVLDNVRLTRAEVDDLSNLFMDLQNTLQAVWPGCRVMPFGSIVTGLGIRTSDVDCFVLIPDNYEYDQAKFVIQARNVLRKHHWIFFKPFAITTAKVPIVKFFHTPTGRHCDVSFKSPSGVRNSKLIAYLLHMDTRALPLAILIKYWSKVHKLTGTNLLPNYSLTMMIIFYLQFKKILPPVSRLQEHANGPFFVDDWNTAFCENYRHKTNNKEGLYELLGGFFQYYSSYKFEECIICPFVGSSLPRRLFMNVDDPPSEFYHYKTMVSEGFDPIKIDTPMCIQDVFEHNRNCTVAVFPRLAMRLTSHIQLAGKIFSDCHSQEFLRQILVQKPDVPKPVLIKRPTNNAPKPNNNAPKANNIAPTPNHQPNNAPAPPATEAVTARPGNLKRPRVNLTTVFMQGRPAKRKKR